MPFNSEPPPPHTQHSGSRKAERLGSVNLSLGIGAMSSLFVWLIANWVLTVRAMVHNYNPLPIWDYWRVVQYFERYKAFDFSALWIQHNEHRIVFPEMVFAIDMLSFHGRQVFALVVSFLCYFLVWIVLSAAFHSDKSLPPLISSAGILLSGVVLGWQGCVVVVGSAFLLQWTMLQLSVTLGLFMLARTRHQEGIWYLAGTITCGVIATYSSGNGMLIWPVMILAGLLISMPRLHFGILIAAGIVSTSLYFVGYRSPHDLNLLAFIAHPVHVMNFIAAYISMPFGAIGSSDLSLIIGYGSLFLFVLILLTVFRRRLFTYDVPILLLGIYLFTVLTAALTAAGRMVPADHQYIAAKAARYVSLPQVNWGALVLAIIWLSFKRRWEIFSPGSIIFAASIMLSAAFLKLSPWVQGNNSAVADQQCAALSLEAGLFSPDILRAAVFPDLGLVKHFLPTLQGNHLSVYWHQPDVTWVGATAKSKFPGAWSNSAQGEISQIYPIVGGAEITGFAPHLKSGGKLILIDAHGKIVGLGERTPAGVPTVIAQGSRAKQDNWVGFLNTAYQSKVFSVYRVTGSNLTRIAGPTAVPIRLNDPVATDIGKVRQ